MFSEDVLTRLSHMNRQRPPVARSTDHSVPGRSSNHDCSAQPAHEDQGEDVSQLPAGEEMTTAWGTHWARCRALRELWPQSERWINQYLGPPESRPFNPTDSSCQLRTLHANVPEGAVYLDLETCGFAGSMVFLVGLIHWHCDRLQLTQLMARNYAEEKSILQALWSIVGHYPLLVTFNGKSFDWPMVHDRSTIHRLGRDTRSGAPSTVATSSDGHESNMARLTPVDPRPELLHCDLLHIARRRWKKKLPDCKLQTLERYVCGRRRTDDIPGREIPTAYHDFVRSGDAWLMRSVLHHNALDLVTLLQLSLLLLRSTTT